VRLALLLPSELSAEQQILYRSMRAGIASSFNAFQVIREDGALMGPWNAYLHEPSIGTTTWDLTKAINQIATLPKTVREIAVLVVGARYRCAFAIYAHVAVAEGLGMPLAQLATICAALKPTDLGAEENLGYDIAHAPAHEMLLPRKPVAAGNFVVARADVGRVLSHRGTLRYGFDAVPNGTSVCLRLIKPPAVGRVIPDLVKVGFCTR
jgi:4-carboxymuconolactone decarboxylase